MLKKILLVVLFFVPGVSTFAACPDIVGKWVISFTQTSGGEDGVGVFRLNFTPTRLNASGFNSYSGSREADSFSSSYTYNSSCKLAFFLDGTLRFEGFAVNPDKIVLIASDNLLNESFRLVADRFNDGT